MAERDEHRVTCPGCGWSRMSRSHGVTITCRRCQTRHYVPAIAADRRGQRDPVRVDCRHCGAAITTRARPQSAIKCPECGRSVWVPVAAPAVDVRSVSGRPAEGERRAGQSVSGGVTGPRPDTDRSTPAARPAPVRRPTPAARPVPPPPAPVRQPTRPAPPPPPAPVRRPTPAAPVGPSVAAALGSLLGGMLGQRATRPAPQASVPTRPAASSATPTGTRRPGRPLASVQFRVSNPRAQCEVHFSTEPPCSRAADGQYTYLRRPVCAHHYYQLRPLAPDDCAYHHPGQQLGQPTGDYGLTQWGL